MGSVVAEYIDPIAHPVFVLYSEKKGTVVEISTQLVKLDKHFAANVDIASALCWIVIIIANDLTSNARYPVLWQCA